jgi:hypothetical protein
MRLHEVVGGADSPESGVWTSASLLLKKPNATCPLNLRNSKDHKVVFFVVLCARCGQTSRPSWPRPGVLAQQPEYQETSTPAHEDDEPRMFSRRAGAATKNTEISHKEHKDHKVFFFVVL